MIFGLIWLIIAVPFVVWLYNMATNGSARIKRSLAVLSACQCPSCGSVFGEKAAGEARLRGGVFWDQQRLASPGRVVKTDSKWPVLCPHCGAKSGFDYRDRVMVPMNW